jgi:hypothetical protein
LTTSPQPAALSPPIWAFALLNLVLVWAVIGLVLGTSRDVWVLYAWALLIVLAQGALYPRARTFVRRLLLFYAGFALFCWGLTLRLEGQTIAGAADVLGLVLRGFAFVLFGHLYGFVLLVPVIAGINEWVWRALGRRAGPA